MNFLHKKIALVFLLITQVAVSMEQESSACGLLESNTFLMGLGTFISNTGAITLCNDERLSEPLIRGCTYAGLAFLGIFRSLLNENVISQCDSDVKIASSVVFISTLVNLYAQTKFMYKKAMHQLKLDNESKYKLPYELYKQTGRWDLLACVIAIGLLYTLPCVATS